MALYKRYNIQLAIPEPIPPNVSGVLNQLENAVANARKHSQRINDGMANEEETVKATWHICRHDEDELCDDEVEIGVDPHPKPKKPK